MRVFRVNNIFYSLQGEGRNTGRAAVFIRFAGCNLRCSFCDTEFNTYREMSGEDILATIGNYPSRFVVLTGGEPTLQVDEAFVDLLHQQGYEVAMESNGTRPAPQNLDWLTVSPKEGGKWDKNNDNCRQPDEIKIVFDDEINPEEIIAHSSFLIPPLLYLQPCDTGDAERNRVITQACVDYIKAHPRWRLSLQTHKLIDIE
jgi:organic radical activating enzyme